MTDNYRHVALTGAPGIGKTTFIKKVVSRLQEEGRTCRGFYTDEVKEEGKRTGFDVVTLAGQTGVLARVNPAGGEKEPKIGNYVVDVKAFESLVLPDLNCEAKGRAVMVLDEIGKMEMLSSEFVRGVRQAISSPTATILASIPITKAKGKPMPLLDQIRRNHNILVLHVTQANRDDQAFQDRIVKLLKASLEKK